ncbi:NAD(P)/FAD-dependent oxidoreductase [Micromonospora sp. RTGN7]|uniref:NAD(P)/FAD-dependent oxidoreductase n=1 Tax=Micromonospora sp. RTGN7 TaxID=3016526 RepID=UPI0029FF322D|nr:NAD(P)/FAD-dependent oxidoreductase [Micromonospora sp. RTGN7]
MTEPNTHPPIAQAYDVVIVGGGAAGLSGALTLARARRRVLVVDSGAPRNGPAGGVHNYLGREGIPPAELLADGRADVIGYGGRVVDGTVTAVGALPTGTGEAGESADRFAVELADGASVRARRLLVTTGLVDELPDVPGLAKRWGRDVLHCPYCHGWEVRAEPVGVLGTGPFAVHQALMVRQWCDDVVLFPHTAPTPTPEQTEQLAARGVGVAAGEVAGLEVRDDRLTGIRRGDGSVVARAALFVAPRMIARSAVLAGLGLSPVDVEMGGYVMGRQVPADAMGATAVPGVWVAGNIADIQAQVIGAAAAGMRAAAAINADLIAEEIAGAVAAHRARAASTVGRSTG